jgi:hypothetical protein
MASRILKYEFRKTHKGTRLILWAPLERGGRTALVSVEGPPGTKPSALMSRTEVKAAIPQRLQKPAA